MTVTEIERTVVAIPRSDGSQLNVRFDLPRQVVNQMLRLSSRQDVRRDVLLHSHMPQCRDGHDLYEILRSQAPGHLMHVAWTQFPADRIPKTWVSWLNSMEAVWVPSRFNRETFARSGVDRARISVVQPLAPTLLRPAIPGQTYPLQTAKSFRFLAVTELNKRRGLDLLLSAYLSEFKPNDDVALVLRTPPPDDRLETPPPAAIEEIARMIVALGHDPERIPEIVVVDELLDDAGLADLHAQSNAFVIPSRCEAIGMAAFDAFAMGLPVIATRFGGMLEYLGDRNAFLVDIEGLETIRNEDVPEHELLVGARWAIPSVDSLRAQMRRVVADPGLCARRVAVARAEVAKHWTVQRLRDVVAHRLVAAESCHPAITRPRAGGRSSLVAWRAPVFDQSGYASEARGFLRSLVADEGFECRVVPHVWSQRAATLDLEDRVLFHRLCHIPTPSRHVSVQHMFPSHFRREAGHAVAIGRTMFETDQIPAGWVDPCNRMDEIWVPCSHNVESFTRAGVDRHKLFVIPGTLDFAGYSPEGPRLPAIPSDRFTFLSVFDWHLRKGWDVLLRAYAEAFSGSQDVSLVLKLQLSNGMPLDAVKKIVREALTRFGRRGRSLPDVQFVGRLAEAELPALYRSVNAFVLPTRGEGFGRPFAEAMAVGLPTIGTNWSGQVDFMDATNAYLIDYRLVPVPPQGVREVPTFAGHRWAEPDVVHLRRLMLEVRDDHAGARARGRKAADDVRRTLSPPVVSATIRERLESWAAKIG